jgi:hypothetical protein
MGGEWGGILTFSYISRGRGRCSLSFFVVGLIKKKELGHEKSYEGG